MGIEEASQHLDLAKIQLERVSTAAWDPEDPAEAVMWAFYAYENCMVAAAESLGRNWKRTHPDKVSIARQLFSDGLVTRDVGADLELLNDLRKQVAYGEVYGDLAELDLEDLAGELESFVDEIEKLIESRRG